MHKLTIEDDEGKTVVVPLIRDEITVGRQEGNSIRLTERNISRRHARFFRQNGTLFVEDLGSFNGIKVNGGKLAAPAALKDGDLVVIGDYKLTVRADRPAATRLYGAATPFIAPAGTAAIPPAPLASTAALPGGALGVQIRPASLPSTAPPPAAALDAAPTIPVRTLAEQSLVAGQGPGFAPARLVVVTTNLAGTEFVLDRPSLVIGRTPENDIVLNHKSISRHHAKIIRDGDKYIVVDLESANGVRVNGGEFERVELKSGDTLELGHVRLRFTSGADYVDFDIGEAGRSRRRLVFAGAGGAVVITGFALAFALRGGEDLGSVEASKPPAPTAQMGAGSPDPSPAPMPPVPSAPSGSAVAPELLLAQAKAAKGKENWDAALEAVKAALELAPLSQEALTLREAIEGEQEASLRFGRIKEAARINNHEEVLNLFSGMAESSIYRPRALSLKRTAQNRVVAERLAEAQKFAAKGECTEARAQADRVLALEPEHDGARVTIERCERVAAKLTEQRQREEREMAAKEAAAREAEARELAAQEARAALAVKEAAAKEAREREAQARAAKEAEERAAKELAAKVAREREAQARAEKEAAAREAKEREALARAAKEAAAKEAKEREAQARAAKEAEARAARELAAKEAKEREAQARAAKEAEAREALALAAKEAREREVRAREAKEAAAREAKEREAQARAAKEAEARAARELAAKEAKEREAQARAAKEAQARAAKELAAKEAREREAQARAAKEAEARAARELAAKEAKEREAQARVAKEAQAKEKAATELAAKAAKEAREREAAAAVAARVPADQRPATPTETRPAGSAAQRALALATTPPPRPPNPPPTQPLPPAAKPPAPSAPETSGADPDALLKDAQQAWLRGQFMLAIDNSRRALKIKPGLTKAYEIIAFCSCSLREANDAAKAYAHLDEKVKPMIKTWCQRSGIQLN
jgi:pSer/pThr/pTyr-binding forkhead associated (FHA) protein